MPLFQSTNSLLGITRSLILQSCRRLTGHRLIFREFGDPLKVLQMETFEMEESVGDDQVLVQVLASSVNPGDMNFIQGNYGLKPDKFPSPAGSEGIAKVLKIGKGVKNIRIGDYVQPMLNRWFAWTTHAISHQQHLRMIPNDLSLVAACTLYLNPGTAYRMLMDFEQLKRGDFVIQNGSNSAVGQAVIQICKDKGLRTINIVRERPDIESLKSTLQEMGADIVVTPKELRALNRKEVTGQSGRPRLGLNCVGGETATDIQQWLADGGTMVTYGGMSLKPLVASVGALIFRDIKIRGFWISPWNHKSSDEEQKEMIEYFANGIRQGYLREPIHQCVPFEDYKTAIANCGAPLQTKKQILIMTDTLQK